MRFKEGIYNSETLLQNYATIKGFMTGRGLPNEAHAARLVLKEYTTGYLNFCKVPPGYVNPFYKRELAATEQPVVPLNTENMMKK